MNGYRRTLRRLELKHAARKAREQRLTAQAEYTGPRCPNCGLEATFTPHGGYSTEPHGETHWDEWLTCNQCGAVTDDRELSSQEIPPKKPFAVGDRVVYPSVNRVPGTVIAIDSRGVTVKYDDGELCIAWPQNLEAA